MHIQIPYPKQVYLRTPCKYFLHRNSLPNPNSVDTLAINSTHKPQRHAFFFSFFKPSSAPHLVTQSLSTCMLFFIYIYIYETIISHPSLYHLFISPPSFIPPTPPQDDNSPNKTREKRQFARFSPRQEKKNPKFPAHKRRFMNQCCNMTILDSHDLGFQRAPPPLQTRRGCSLTDDFYGPRVPFYHQDWRSVPLIHNSILVGCSAIWLPHRQGRMIDCREWNQMSLRIMYGITCRWRLYCVLFTRVWRKSAVSHLKPALVLLSFFQKQIFGGFCSLYLVEVFLFFNVNMDCARGVSVSRREFEKQVNIGLSWDGP